MITIPIVIRTTHSTPELTARLEWFLAQPGCKWERTSRKQFSPHIPMLTISKSGVTLSHSDERVSFHPSMALLRLMNIQRGEVDRYLQATSLQQGDTLLDLTLGLGTDALVGAYAVGDGGHVIGVEDSAILAALVRDGLITLGKGCVPRVMNETKQQAWQELAQAAGRIKVFWGEHLDFLREQTAQSADVVYFDPMFRIGREESSSIKPLRVLAERQALAENAILEARRVARRRIVLKERKASAEFARLGFKIFPGGRYSQVDYGIIDLK